MSCPLLPDRVPACKGRRVLISDAACAAMSGRAGFPTFEAELGYAIARGWMHPDPGRRGDPRPISGYRGGEAQHAREVRKSADTWRRIHRHTIRLRVRELTTANANARLPWNAIMAQAHEINRSQTLDEAEVTAIVEAAVYDSLPDSLTNTPKGRRHGT